MQKYVDLKKEIQTEDSAEDNITKRFIKLFIELDSLDLKRYIELEDIINNKLKSKKRFEEYFKFCNLLFEKINFKKLSDLRRKLNPLDKSDIKIYGKIIKQNIENDGELKVEISLTTEYMINFDSIFLSKDGVYRSAIKIYKHINTKNEVNKLLIEINKKLSKLNKENINFFTLDETETKLYLDIIINTVEHLCRPYFFEFIGHIKEDSSKKHELKQYEFYEFEFVESIKESDFSGDIIFAASPFEISGYELKLKKTDPVSKDIIEKKQLDCKTLDNIIKHPTVLQVSGTKPNELGSNNLNLNTLLKTINSSNISSIEYRINHVGQGFNSYFLFNSNSTILFDLGYSMSPEDRTITRLGKHYYKNKSPELVILSHWDVDHILGIAHCNKSIFDAPWIVPDLNYKIKDFSLSAARLNLYLQIQEKRKNTKENNKNQYLYNIDNSYNEKKIDSLLTKNNYQFNLYKGRGTHNVKTDTFKNSKGKEMKISRNTNEKNNIGIYIEVVDLSNKIKNQILLSPGDCDYDSLSSVNYTSNNYDYLVASHHGARADIPNFGLKNKATIIVPVGKNEHAHPVYLDNLKTLEKTFNAKIIETQYQGDHQISLIDE